MVECTSKKSPSAYIDYFKLMTSFLCYLQIPENKQTWFQPINISSRKNITTSDLANKVLIFHFDGILV